MSSTPRAGAAFSEPGWPALGRSRAAVVVSDSTWTAPDHGVHTAFVEQMRALRTLGLEVRENDLRACRGAWVTTVHTQGPLGMAALLLARPRVVAYAHVTPRDLVGSFRLERVWRPLPTCYLRAFYRAAPAVVAVSELVRAELLELGVPEHRVHVIPNGIDARRFMAGPRADVAAQVAARRRPGRALVLCVGQTQARKGLDVFADVARHVPEADFAWVGGRPFGALQPAVGPIVGRTPDNLALVGRVSDHELVAWYHAADVSLFPSRHENFGQVVVEAAASGLPLVLSDIPVFREHFACAAELCSIEAMPAVVRRLLHDHAYRAQRAAAARLLASRYTAQRSAEALLSLATRLASEPAGTRPVPRTSAARARLDSG